MIDADRKEFFSLIAEIYAFYRKDFSSFAGNVWWAAMKPYDYAAVTDALNRHCVNPDNGQFLPMPADIVRMLQGSTQDAALVAWSKVDTALRTVGTYRSVVFDDPLVHRVLTEMGGWIPLGTKTEDEWPFVRNEFVNRYRGYRGRSQVPEYPPVLLGLAEAHNSKEGFKVDKPMLIGHEESAKRVLVCGVKTPLLGIVQMSAADTAKSLELSEDRQVAMLH